MAACVADVANAYVAHHGTADQARQLWLVNEQRVEQQTADILAACSRVIQAEKGADGCNQFLALMQDLAEQMPERDAQAAEILATVLGWLAMNTRAEDPLHRQRTLLLIKHVLKGLVRGKRPLDEEAQELLEGRCLERLDDKIAVVRKTAVDVLPYLFILSGNGEAQADSPVVDALIKYSAEDTIKTVRAALVQAMVHILSCCDNADVRAALCEAIVKHAGDQEVDVRSAVFTSLKDFSLPCTAFTLPERIALLERGLRDRAPFVRQAAAALCGSWLDACGGRVEELVKLLDVWQNAVLLCSMLDQLVDSKQLCRIKLLSSDDTVNLRQPRPRFTAETAFIKRYACVALRNKAQELAREIAKVAHAAADQLAAEARPFAEALEAGLPECTMDMVSLLQYTADQGPAQRFVLKELLCIATACMDWTDAEARTAGRDFLSHTLLCLDPRQEGEAQVLCGCGGDGSWERGVARFALAVSATPSDVLTLVTHSLRDNMTAWGMTTQDGDSGPCWLQCLTLLHETVLLRSVWPCVLSLVKAPHTPVAGDDRDTGDADTAAHKDYTWLVDQLLWPAYKQTSPEARPLALRLLGRLAVSDVGCLLTRVWTDSLTVLTSAHEACVVRAQAARTLCDIAAVRGTQAVTWEVWREAHTGARADATQDVATLTDQMAGTSLGDQSSPPDLIICLTELLHEAITPKPKEKTRAVAKRGKAKAAEAPAAPAAAGVSSELLCALVEGTTRLLSCQPYLTQYAQRMGTPNAPLSADEVQVLLRQLLVFASLPDDSAALCDTPRVLQHLAMFFQEYARRPEQCDALASAVIPAATAAFTIPMTSTKTAASRVVTLTKHLLLSNHPSQQNKAQQQGAEGEGEEEALAGVLGDVSVCEWVGRVCVACAVELDRLTDQERPVAGTDDLCKELAAFLMALPLQPVEDRLSIRVALFQSHRCLQQLTRRDKVPKLLSDALKKLHTHMEGLEQQAEEQGAEQVTDEHIQTVITDTKKAMYTEAGPSNTPQQPTHPATTTERSTRSSTRGKQAEPSKPSVYDTDNSDVYETPTNTTSEEESNSNSD